MKVPRSPSDEPVDPGAAPAGHPPGAGSPGSPGAARGERFAVVGAVAAGGALGATARYAASLLWPTPDGGFPWTTLWVNGAGCAVIGVFMVIVTDVWAAPPLVRPFFGTGVLGGFTTFSTYVTDVQQLADGGRPLRALAYLAGTLLVALAAVWSAAWLTRRIVAGRREGAR
ncbi:fluoride efflux transporter CrcB [Streptomyces omiyaensis]|uniref:fluoride efflux transporter CrcB n=1 Tax=Streptomyces omiyaensis TaxID=68247 RepID=UPI0036FDC45A